MSCETSHDFIKVRNQCVDMLLDRGVPLKDIPEAPPKSLIARYLSLSHEKGDSPLLDIPVEQNPILFLYSKDVFSGSKVMNERIFNTLKYHGLNTNRKVTIVYLGDLRKDIRPIENALKLNIEHVQIYDWKTLLVPI